MESRIRNLLDGAELRDIHVGGFIDPDDEPARFYPQARLMVLELKTGLIELRVLGDTGRAALSVVDRFPTPDEIEEDCVPCWSSVSEQLLRVSYGDLRIVSAQFFDEEVSGNSLVCGGFELTLANKDYLFFDPSYHFGIKVGGADQKAVWLENRPPWP